MIIIAMLTLSIKPDGSRLFSQSLEAWLQDRLVANRCTRSERHVRLGYSLPGKKNKRATGVPLPCPCVA